MVVMRVSWGFWIWKQCWHVRSNLHCISGRVWWLDFDMAKKVVLMFFNFRRNEIGTIPAEITSASFHRCWQQLGFQVQKRKQKKNNNIPCSQQQSGQTVTTNMWFGKWNARESFRFRRGKFAKQQDHLLLVVVACCYQRKYHYNWKGLGPWRMKFACKENKQMDAIIKVAIYNYNIYFLRGGWWNNSFNHFFLHVSILK